MNTEILLGKPIASRIRSEIASRTAHLSRPPCLAAVKMGEDPASSYYISSQMRNAAKLGIDYKLIELAAESTQADLNFALQTASGNTSIDGIILLTPLPRKISIAEAREFIAPEKDIEGVTPTALGRLAQKLQTPVAPTARAAFAFAKEKFRDLAGVETVVAGYSDTVGKPLAMLLLNERATVTVARSRVRDLPELIGRAELVFVCMGKARYVRGEWLRPGSVVIDVGMNELEVQTSEGGKTVFVGDLDYDSAIGIAGAVTPVPRGVGTVTTAYLFFNLLEAAERQFK